MAFSLWQRKIVCCQFVRCQPNATAITSRALPADGRLTYALESRVKILKSHSHETPIFVAEQNSTIVRSTVE